jgi:two-component system, OmpR family, sensor kinase
MLNWFRTTRSRLVLLQLGILASAAAFTAVAIFELVTVPARYQEDQVLFDQWSAVANALDLQNGKVVYPPGQLPAASLGTQQPVEIDVFTTTSGLLVQTERQSLSPNYLGDLAGRVLRGAAQLGPLDVRDASGAGRRVYAAAQPLGDGPSRPQAAVIVSVATADLDTLIQRLLWALLAGSLLVIAIGGALAWALVGRTLRPVRAMAAAARAIGDQDLHSRVTVSAPADEVGELKATFNEMLDRLERSFTTLRRFTADASHELRTPLTLMRTDVDFALTRERSPDEYQRVLGRLQRELEHLGHVSEQLLLLAQADAGSLTPMRVEVDVADLVEEVGARWRRFADERAIRLQVVAPESGTMNADPNLVGQVLDNLLDNALRHGPRPGRVQLLTEQLDGEWRFDVTDEGGGVPAELRDRIFERFTRADPARNRRTGGAGLGLSLSAAIARAHGGNLELIQGAPGSGATFRLRIPAAQAE